MAVVNVKMSLSLVRTQALSTKCIVPVKGILTKNVSSSFMSRGFVSKNVKGIKKEEAAALQKLECLVENIYSQDEFPKITKSEFKMLVQDPVNATENNPIVLLFGWGGANYKNLSKYADIYLGAGVTTAQYILPTRHIFRDTAQIPELMGNLLIQLEKLDIHDRPVFIHCLSDTGVMCYQGMDVVRKQSSKMQRMNLCGVVWDSCCGPRPEMTLTRVMALLTVNWFCCMRDGMGMVKSMNSSYRLLLDRAWPGLLGKWQGKPFQLSEIEGTWSGDFGKDHYRTFPSVPELFIYSNKDYYLPFSYLEKEVLEPRKKVGANFTAVKFHGSAHVAHIRHFREEYKTQVLSFLKLKETTDTKNPEKGTIDEKKKQKDTGERLPDEHSLQPRFL